MATTIYTLTDPRDGAVRYVGKTCQSLARRLRGHLAAAKSRRTHRDCWIFGLVAEGLLPQIRAVEQNVEDWASRERHWIRTFREFGADLTNLAEGGQGPSGVTPSAHNREVSARLQRQKMADPEARRALSEKVAASWTPERKAAKAVETANRMATGLRQHLSTMQNSAEVLERNRQAQRDYWTPERRALRAAEVIARAQKPVTWTPEMRAAQAERTRQQHAARRAGERA